MRAATGVGSGLIVALDVPDQIRAEALLARIGDCDRVKVGLELFVAEGPAIARWLAERGYRVMLDLKLHDIPATVARAVSRVGDLGVEFVTVHTGGGAAMLDAAVHAAAASRVKILGVTVLTSMVSEDLAAVGVGGNVDDVVVKRVALAASCGVVGVVASVGDVPAIRASHPNLLTVTPGIRPAGSKAGDQKRIATPAEAKAAGASMIVVGRPIRDAASPASVAAAIIAEFRG